MIRAGLGKVLVSRLVSTDETKQVVVWGKIENIGPRCISGQTFGQGYVAYANTAGTVVEEGLEIVDEKDVLAYKRLEDMSGTGIAKNPELTEDEQLVTDPGQLEDTTAGVTSE